MTKEKLPLEEEKKLIERAKKSPEAFGELYDLYFDSIFTYIVYRVSGREQAEDITSQVFEKAMKSIQRFEWQGYSYGSWLYKIAHNLIIDSYKAKKDTVSIEESILIKDEEEENIEFVTKKDLDLSKLLRAIEILPTEQREIVYLRYVKELSIKETVEVTGKSVDSVKSLAKRALNNLKKNLNPKK